MDIFDVIVVGAGHAGCEAALAAARLGKRTLLLTMQIESVAMMPCNPSIGGTGKGQLVKEIDALGGEMGLLIDRAFIQSKMLNRSKGPAVHSPRAQADKQRYHEEMLRALGAQGGLELRCAEVVDLLLSNDSVDTVGGVVLQGGEEVPGRAVVLATGTYLNGLVHISDRAWPSGPSGLRASVGFAENLKRRGFPLRRFKTGTPARVLAPSLRYEEMTEQPGDDVIEPFSYINEGKYIGENRASCWMTYTNPEGHKIVAENIGRTAPYGGHTTGTGPRYCLSIEDKVSRFPDRERHQLFLEPEGLSTEEVYIQGMSTSLPEDIQEVFYRTIKGLEDAVISRYGYSIEYDCIDPLSLLPSLESKKIRGLFFAGQVNGTSGYEEAAAQGLVAGVNAARLTDGLAPYVPDRSEAYIGVLIDDLTTKGTEEPYRIMTSRAEFRLVLRQDNADLRLTRAGYALGLASEERFLRAEAKRRAIEAALGYTVYSNGQGANACAVRLSSVRAIPDSSLPKTRNSLAFLPSETGSLEEPRMKAEQESATAQTVGFFNGNELCGIAAAPAEAHSASIRPLPVAIDLPLPEELKGSVARQVEIERKYKGYIEKQRRQVEKFRKLESKRLPQDLDYGSMDGLRLEARQKLSAQRPASLGAASRISGVSPADIAVLMVQLARRERS
ncbi:MAG: tRNA uridine-5-carboxymethylaminomethyl(34) synthesis enzyme MnmG [Clostridiales Family XIII bacterium]|jgi:tRNA uridine 5-carboxymethylaminomethyl modification enzyme|nr:tRNA uridine-5-carboxymethylaminomethyl(34) synthesis enzyme MnmG [Clostridiales Family XIII bacterium]